MRKDVRTIWVWIAVAILLLLVGVSFKLGDVAALTPGATTAVSPIATTTAEPVPVAFDEEQAANELEAQVIAIYDLASPAVVNITNRSYVYDRFMGAVPEEGTGSGFVYDTEGHIVTNYHVIANAQELLVTLADGRVLTAEVVGSDANNDLAVIQIDAGEDLPAPLVLGDSDKLRVGQFVVAIGNPYGLQQTLTTGVVSALGRVIQGAGDNSFIGEAIQTDAAINPGNSGGPLLDLHGRIIGINSQIISPSGASAGIGFAVSANTARRVVPKLIEQGYFPHVWLGADMFALSASTVQILRDAGVDVPVDSGLLVLDTAAGGPAERAGIRGGNRIVRVGRYQFPEGGDVIVALDGQPVDDLQTLTVYLETETNIGDTVDLTIRRGDQELTVPLTLEEQPRE
jgi:S1-C subfamily serine protease